MILRKQFLLFFQLFKAVQTVVTARNGKMKNYVVQMLETLDVPSLEDNDVEHLKKLTDR